MHELDLEVGHTILIAAKTPNWLPMGEKGPVWCPPRRVA